MEAGWLLRALLRKDIWFIIYPVVHVFKDQILATNTVDFGWSFYCALYLNTLIRPSMRLWARLERSSIFLTERL